MKIISLMSGTSLDGIDIAFCDFLKDQNKNWKFYLIHAKTYKYQDEIITKLKNAINYNSVEYLKFDAELGFYFGNVINTFINEFSIDKNSIQAISSHGHTIHHQPEQLLTSQIGHGSAIAIITNLPVINNFRIKDVFLGGQGAPLVPIGDQLLFSSLAQAFLNIGGITNISLKVNETTVAFDICPGNLPSNHYVAERNLHYDKNGAIASSGKIHSELLNELNSLEFYNQTYPKSLGIEWLINSLYPVVDRYLLKLEDKLATINEHIANQISYVLKSNNIKKLLITGGGAYNTDLIERIKNNSNCEILIPNNEIIEFKEAIIFGLLGALYLLKEKNTLATVTGANRNSIGGVLHLPD
jgi:anhydro-N-acetylmuramic acid kinase